MTSAAPALPNRWLIAVCGTVLQLCLGTVYAWSYFQNLLKDAYGWTNGQTALTFSLAICFLGLAAAWGGINLAKFGPRKLAMTGAALFGVGYLLGGLALHLKSLPLLYAGYGVIGGIGLGLGYVTPVATVAKWFPDKKGLLTGMVVMGFGFGALLMTKVVAPGVSSLFTGPDGVNYAATFAVFGLLFLAFGLPVAWCLRNPPAGYVPSGWTPPPSAAASDVGLTPAKCLLSGRFLMMWLVFFCNITAGIAIVSFQSPLFQDILNRIDPTALKIALAAAGATLVAVSSVFNGVGRFFWGGLSDRIGRVQAFRAMLLTQVAAFILLAWTGNQWLFAGLVCWVLLCYGGGFGTMPSFVTDVFGQRMMPIVYGAILTAWSAGGVVGPLIFASIKDHFPTNTARAAVCSFYVAGGFVLVGLVLSIFLSNRPLKTADA